MGFIARSSGSKFKIHFRIIPRGLDPRKLIFEIPATSCWWGFSFMWIPIASFILTLRDVGLTEIKLKYIENSFFG